MKKLFKYSCMYTAITAALVLMTFAPFAPLVSTAQAQAPGVTTGPTLEQAGFITTGPTLEQAGKTNTNNPNPAATNPTTQKPGAVDNNGDIGCSVWNIVAGNTAGTFALCLTNVVYVFTVGIGSGFAYVAAYFFDWAVNISLNSAAYALTFISQGWATARDIANMAFLFILLYIAFVIMFQAYTTGTVQMLTWVVVIALLVNFSFFFTRVVIDAGNIMAIQFYNAIQAPSIETSAQTAALGSVGANINSALGSSNTKDLTASIMGMMQLQNLFGSDSFKAFFNGGSDPNNPTAKAGFMVTTIALSFLYIAAAIMFWLLTVAFVVNGAKFLMRVVVLWFLIIASPLAFVARAVPRFKGYFDKWLEALIIHASYPVAFMFIFLILSNFAVQMSCTSATGQAIQGCTSLINGIFNGLQSAGSSSSAVAAIGYAVANVGIRLGFVIAVLYIGLKASDKIGTMGADMAKHAGDWVSGAYKGAFRKSGQGAGWMAGAGYRWTGGALANKLDEKIKGSQWANRPGTLGGVIGYRLRRNVLAPARETSLGTIASSYKERQEFLKGRKGDMTNNLRDRETRDIVKKVAAAPATATDQDKDRIKNLNKREMEGMKADDLEKVAQFMSADQIKKIAEIEKLNDTEKEKIRIAWNERAVEAPLQKANKQIEILRKIESDLRTSGITVSAVATNVGTTAAPAVGVTIDSNSVTAMLKDVEKEMNKVESDIRKTAPGKDTTGHRENLRSLQKAQKALEKLDDERKNVPVNAGGESEAGKFKTV